MSRLNHVLYGAALTLLAATAPIIGHADASTASQVRSMSVRYGDLTLDRPADVATLYRRITVAADKVCGVREITGSHMALLAYQNCYDAAVSRAVTAVARPALSAYYASQPFYPGAHAPALARR